MSSGFPSLQPALVLIFSLKASRPIGKVASGSVLTHYETSTGTLKSVPGFTPVIDAEVVFGADWLYTDPDGSKARLNVKGVAKNHDGVMISFGYQGVAHLNDAAKLVFGKSPEARTMPFGQSASHHTFEVGDEKYKKLEDRVWVGNGRFIVDGGGVSVESRISLVVPSTDEA